MLRVKSLCKKKGITFKKLASDIGVTAEAITRMLKEDGNPRLSNLKNIAKVLDVEVYELFDDYKSGLNVKGYLEVNNEVHKVESYSDLVTIYNLLSEKL